MDPMKSQAQSESELIDVPMTVGQKTHGDRVDRPRRHRQSCLVEL